MFQDFAKSNIGLISILIVSSLVGWVGTKFDETLLQKDITTISLLFYETIMLAIVLGIVCIFSKKERTSLFNSFYNLNVKHIIALILFSVSGLLLGIVSDIVLLHHGTGKIRMWQIIVSFIVRGSLYFLMESKNFNIKKLLFFSLTYGAVGFAMNS